MKNEFIFFCDGFYFRNQTRSPVCEGIKQWCCIYFSAAYSSTFGVKCCYATQFVYTGQLPVTTPAIPGMFPNMFPMATGQVLAYLAVSSWDAIFFQEFSIIYVFLLIVVFSFASFKQYLWCQCKRWLSRCDN